MVYYFKKLGPLSQDYIDFRLKELGFKLTEEKTISSPSEQLSSSDEKPLDQTVCFEHLDYELVSESESESEEDDEPSEKINGRKTHKP